MALVTTSKIPHLQIPHHVLKNKKKLYDILDILDISFNGKDTKHFTARKSFLIVAK